MFSQNRKTLNLVWYFINHIAHFLNLKNMKSFLPLPLTTLFLCVFVSCTAYFNRIDTYHDEFKGTKKYILQHYVLPQERRSPVGSVNITYEKEITAAKTEVFNMYFVFTRGTTSFNIDRKGFLKIGSTRFDIETKSMQTELKTGVNDTSTTTTDSTGTHTIASSETVHWVNDKFKIALSPEMIAEIAKNQAMMIRFYSGPIPVTFIVQLDYYARLKEMMAKM